MSNRGLELINFRNKSEVVAKNKLLTEYALEYAEIIDKGVKEVRMINYAREYKGVLLIFDFFGVEGKCATMRARYNEEKSSIE